MYLPAYFRQDDHAEQLRFMQEHPFAVLVTAPDGVLYATHLPVLIQMEGDQLYLRSHLARANKQWQHFGNQEVLVIFQGPHALVDPRWYDSRPNVPTWNYTAVHAYGVPCVIDGPATHEIAYGLVQQFTPDMETVPPEFEERMFKALVTFELQVTRLEGKYKLSQNKTPQDRQNVQQHLARSERPEERQTAAYMARLPEQE